MILGPFDANENLRVVFIYKDGLVYEFMQSKVGKDWFTVKVTAMVETSTQPATGGRLMKKIKWGVIGLGRFGEVHCDALAVIPRVEFYALCTRRDPA